MRGEYLYNALWWYYSTEIDDTSLAIATCDLILRNSQLSVSCDVGIDHRAIGRLDLARTRLPNLVVLRQKPVYSVLLVSTIFMLIIERPFAQFLVLKT